MINKFTTIICSESSRISAGLGLNFLTKIFNAFSSIRLIFEEVYIGEPSTIIEEAEGILSFTNRFGGNRS